MSQSEMVMMMGETMIMIMIVISRIMGIVIEIEFRVAIGMVKLDGYRDLEEN